MAIWQPFSSASEAKTLALLSALDLPRPTPDGLLIFCEETNAYYAFFLDDVSAPVDGDNVLSSVVDPGARWVKTNISLATGPSDAREFVEVVRLTPASPTSQILRALDTGDLVTFAQVAVDVAFDVGSSFSLGLSGNLGEIFDHVDLDDVADYQSSTILSLPSPDLLTLTLFGSLSTGNARLVYKVVKP